MDWYLYGMGQNWIMPPFSWYNYRFDIMDRFITPFMPVLNFHRNTNFEHNINYYDTPIYENMGLSLSNYRTSRMEESYPKARVPRETETGVQQPVRDNNNSNQLGNNIANTAKKYLGYKESDDSYKKFTHGRAEAWCADFVSYVARECGLTHIDSPSVSGLLKCGTFSNQPKVGDAIIFRKYDKNNNEYLSHTGIVTRIENGRVYTIEGNLSDNVAESSYDMKDKYIKGYVTLA